MRASPFFLVLCVLGLGCTTLSPSAESVKVTRDPKDVVGCRVVGQVSGLTGNQALPGTTNKIKNAAAAMGADVVFVTLSVSNGEGVAYRCKGGDPQSQSVSSPAPISDLQAEFNRTIPTCTGAVECKAKWDAAQRWILQNLRLKIQNVTDVFIETYGPAPNSLLTAARVMKDPVDSRTYRIVINTYCNNSTLPGFACEPNQSNAALAFNRYVNSAPIPESDAPNK